MRPVEGSRAIFDNSGHHFLKPGGLGFMTETSQKESPKEEARDDVAETSLPSGLGVLLRNEREKKGLSHDQVAQVTRLRKHFLVAMENEDWNLLPPPVFVKGFIRSYAKALEMDEAKLLDLYKSTVTEPTEAPTPIIEPKKSRRGSLLLLLTVLGILAIATYFFLGRTPQEAPVMEGQEEISTESREEPGSGMAQPEPQKEEPTPPIAEEEAARTPEQGAGLGKAETPEPVVEEKRPETYPSDEDLYIAPTPETPSPGVERVLTGNVRKRTWIRIYIDDEAPKEYILQPGSRPQWKAKKGFYVLVGNAAGIDFDFDGKALKDLGGPGQVISLRLPKDFQRKISEE